MVHPAGSSASVAPLETPGQPRRERAAPGADAFTLQLLAVLQESMGKLGLRAESVQTAVSEEGGAGSAQNSSQRRFVVALSPAQAAPSQSVPTESYVAFDKEIPAGDIDAINSQQTARNRAFQDWVGGISSDLSAAGYKPEITFEQSEKNWYEMPVIARIRFPDLDPAFESALTLYHYDTWQDIDAAETVLRQALAAQEA